MFACLSMGWSRREAVNNIFFLEMRELIQAETSKDKILQSSLHFFLKMVALCLLNALKTTLFL